MTDQVDLFGEAPEAGSPPDKKYLSVREATLIHDPASIATLLGIIVLGVVLDFWWKRAGGPGQAGPGRELGPQGSQR